MRIVTVMLAVAVMLSGCMAAGQTKEDKRRNVENMRKEVLTDLYKQYPGSANEIKNATGYAVFSSWNAAVIFVSAWPAIGG